MQLGENKVRCIYITTLKNLHVWRSEKGEIRFKIRILFELKDLAKKYNN